MKFTSMKRYQGLIITIIQTAAAVLIAFVITVFQCKFKLEDFNWMSFCLNFLLTTYMKISYTNFSKNKELATEEITLLQNTISIDRREIFDAQKTDAFINEVERRNHIHKLEAYIEVLDNTKITKKNREKIIELRNWAFDYKKALLNEQDITEYEKTRSLKSINVYYEYIDPSKLFAYGKCNKTRKSKYTFNAFSSSLNRAIIPTTLSIVWSIVWGAVRPDEIQIGSGQVWVDLMGYLFSISLGSWWGWTNGKTIIQEDYLEVLNNVAALIRDVKAKVLI